MKTKPCSVYESVLALRHIAMRTYLLYCQGSLNFELKGPFPSPNSCTVLIAQDLMNYYAEETALWYAYLILL